MGGGRCFPVFARLLKNAYISYVLSCDQDVHLSAFVFETAKNVIIKCYGDDNVMCKILVFGQ